MSIESLSLILAGAILQSIVFTLGLLIGAGVRRRKKTKPAIETRWAKR
jgi:hypothetical protein